MMLMTDDEPALTLRNALARGQIKAIPPRTAFFFDERNNRVVSGSISEEGDISNVSVLPGIHSRTTPDDHPNHILYILGAPLENCPCQFSQFERFGTATSESIRRVQMLERHLLRLGNGVLSGGQFKFYGRCRQSVGWFGERKGKKCVWSKTPYIRIFLLAVGPYGGHHGSPISENEVTRDIGGALKRTVDKTIIDLDELFA